MSASPNNLISPAAQVTDAEALAQLRLVTDHAPVLLVYCDRDIRFKFVNKPYADRLGLTPDEIVGRRIPEVIGEGAYATFHHHIEETLSGRRVEFEAEIPYEAIGPHVMQCTCAPDFGPDGEVRGLVAVLVDVTERRRGEVALRDSQQRFTQFMEHLPGMAWIKDIEGRYVYANDYVIRTFRTPQEELYGMTDAELFPPHTAALLQANDEAARESPAGVQVVEELEHPALGLRHMLVSKFPLAGPDGEMNLVGGMAVDITDWRRAEQEMRHSELRFRSLMEQAPFSIQVFSPDGTTLSVNHAWEKLWGFTLGDLGDYNVLEDKQLEAKGVLDYIRQGFAGNPTRVPAIAYDPTETLPRLVPLEDHRRWLSAVIYPLKDAEGTVREVVIIHEDITARHRAEKELEYARTRLDAALEAGAVATWTYDVPENRLYIDKNIVRLFDLPPEEPLDAPLERFTRTIHPDDWPRVQAALQRALDGHDIYEAEYRHVQVTGRVRWVISRGKVERDDEGRPVRMPGVLFEITQRKQLEEELRLRIQQLDEVDRRKDEFLATLAHELRNPLAPICNSLQILKMPRVESDILKQTREMMERQVQHLVRLVDDLLDVSRVMRGKVELRHERVELATIIARAVETAQPLIDNLGHELVVSVSDESLLVDADPVRLSQVIGNLLTNAAKYTEPGGHIWLAAHREEGQALLTIRDDGIGISPPMLAQIFQLFVQVDHTSTKAQGGLGIGLTLAKNLVEMHGGTLEARSPGLGEGSEFRIRLPLAPDDVGQPTREDEPATQFTVTRPRYRLLVVDDNHDAATTLAMLLRLRRHEVQVAHNGPAALAAAQEFRPALIFLDLGMPGMDGYEVARHLRALPLDPQPVLVALTGWGQEEDRRRTAEAGFDHHLVKPPEPKGIDGVLASLTK